MSANGGMTPESVKSTVNSLEMSKKAENPKAVMKGTNLGGKSNSGGLKESGFMRGPK